jgi:hypothetical protein
MVSALNLELRSYQVHALRYTQLSIKLQSTLLGCGRPSSPGMNSQALKQHDKAIAKLV